MSLSFSTASSASSRVKTSLKVEKIVVAGRVSGEGVPSGSYITKAPSVASSLRHVMISSAVASPCLKKLSRLCRVTPPP